ncbi:MAG: MMPL family transporter [Puniceicoccales bacterium]|jgi:predicted exporter|nr:MMPL family transporter [Puniceicoccales bacterium]
MNPRIHRRLALVWLAAVAAILSVLAWLLPRAKFETDILALLPRDEAADAGGAVTALPADVADACTARLNRQLVWLVADGAGARNASQPAAQWWFEHLRAMPEFASVGGPVDAAAQRAWGAFWFDHRRELLAPGARERLASDPAGWAQWVLAQIYSPLAGVGSGELSGDPLLLVRARQLALAAQAGPLTLDGGWPTATDAADRRWRLVRAELAGSSFDLEGGRALVAKLAALERELAAAHPGASVLRRGTLFYSDYAAAQSKRDISLLGGISLIGVALVILLFFRSWRPLALTLLSTATGAAAGIAALLACFDTVHLVSLVLSTSVIGVSVDYALHCLTERMVHGGERPPLAGLRELLPALALAFATTALAYAALGAAPFPAFRQLAVFALAGLAAAFLCVVLWFPFLCGKIPRRVPAGAAPAARWLRLWREHRWLRIGAPAAVALAGAAGLLALRPDDDAARLQVFPPELRESDRCVAALTGQPAETNWFIVRATGAGAADAVLRGVEQLGARLEKLRAAGGAVSFRLLTDQLPPLERQRANYAAVAAATPVVLRHLREAEVELPAATQPAAPPAVPFRPVTPAEWARSPVSEAWRLLWFGDLPDGGAAALVPVAGAADNARMNSLAAELTAGAGVSGAAPAPSASVHWLNRRAQVSDTFGTYRWHLERYLALALALAGVVFAVRFGILRGLRSLLPVVLAAGAALGALVLTGQAYNLFALLALVLVLGIGIDYTLFFGNDAAAPTTTLLAVCVDFATTLLSFGVLALSATPAIAGFGVVLVAGLTVAFLLAPLALEGRK